MTRMSIASGAFDSDLLLGATQTVLDALKQDAVLEGEFTLSSGKPASYYVDVARISLRQPGFAALAVIVANAALTARCTVVGGPLVGAAPLATAAMVGFSQARGVIESSVHLPSWASNRLRDQAAAFYLRDGVKDHGAGGRIVGYVPEGSRVMLVDDVVSTGESLDEAVLYCRTQGIDVQKVFALVDRDKGAGEFVLDVPYEYAFTMQDLGLEPAPLPPLDERARLPKPKTLIPNPWD